MNWHRLDQCCMEELTKLCHQAAPLVLLGIIAEEAVQRGVEGVCDFYLWSKCIDNCATSTGLRVEYGSGQRADWAPGLGQRIIILHLECTIENKLNMSAQSKNWFWLYMKETLLPPADWKPPLCFPLSDPQWHILGPGRLQLCAWCGAFAWLVQLCMLGSRDRSTKPRLWHHGTAGPHGDVLPGNSSHDNHLWQKSEFHWRERSLMMMMMKTCYI